MFEEIVGHTFVKSYIENALLKDELHHALLFSGPSGVGKFFFAKELAKVLLESTKKEHPDLHIYEPTGKARQITIDTIRSITEEVYKPPFEAKRKVFIIKDADRMNVAASNALLKTLEEPSLDTTIILTTSNQESLLPTISSRVIQLSFHRIADSELREYLVNQEEDSSKVETLLSYAKGSIGRALSVLSHPNQLKKRELFVEMMLSLSYLDYMQKAKELTSLIEEENNYQDIDELFSSLSDWHRDLALCNESQPRYFPEVKNASYTVDLEEGIAAIAKAKEAIERHSKPLHALEYLFLSVNRASKSINR